MAAIIFANCAVLDGTRRERREDHHVLVEGGQIREVSDRPITSATAETVDLKGRTLMPGLIDAHVHVIAVDQALARLSERPVSLVTLQAARVLEGHAAARLHDDPRRRRSRWRARRGGGGGAGARPADFPLGTGVEPDRRTWRSAAAHALGVGRSLRLLRGRRRARPHRRRRRGMPPRGARRAAQRGDPDQDHGLGRRRLALRPGVEPAIQRRGGARDRRGGARPGTPM